MSPNDAPAFGPSPSIKPQAEPPANGAPARRRGVPIAAALGIGFGAFVALAVSAELLIGYVGAERTTYELVRDRTVTTLDSIVQRIRFHLQPALDQVQFVARRIESVEIDPDNQDRLAEALMYALAATPQVTAMMYIAPDLSTVGVRRIGERVERHRFSLAELKDAGALMEEMRTALGPYWGEVRQGAASGVTVINLRAPLRRDNQFIGALTVAISILDLSRLMAEIGAGGTERPFVLLGRDRVLAHPAEVFGLPGESKPEMPLPAVAEYGDSVLAQLWNPAKSRLIERRGDTEARFVEAEGGRRVVVFRQIDAFGKEPWIVGTQFMASELGVEFERLNRMVYVGLGVLALAVIAAAMLGRHLSRPIQALAEVADAIRHLELKGIAPLPRSRLREIDRAARAFNAMIATMAWVETYLPRRLVKQLIRRQAGVESDERVVTVLFTDIVGFTALSEHRPARDVAKLLNDHFALVEKCIADEGGTLDKYIGDSAMAFWNAPEAQPDHASRACRAAIAITHAMREDAKRRREAGEPVLRLRVGLHTGPALVGNVGAPGRMDYTIIGDTVNTAQRLERLGKRFDDGVTTVIVLASESTARAAGAGLAMTQIGMRGLAGREKPITVFRLG